jgi:hypothetical protein
MGNLMDPKAIKSLTINLARVYDPTKDTIDTDKKALVEQFVMSLKDKSTTIEMYNAAKALYKEIDGRISSKVKAHKQAVKNRQKSRAGNKK